MRFPFKILDNRLPHQGIARLVDHFFDGNQFDNIRKMHIAGAVHRAHPPNSNHILDHVAVNQKSARNQMFIWPRVWGKILSNMLSIQRVLPRDQRIK